MIKIHLKATKKSFFGAISNVFTHPNNKTGETYWEESKRKDAIIKHMVKELPYAEGEYCQPSDAADRAKYGTSILVEKICDSYAKYGRGEKWPDNDVPLIVTAYSALKDYRFICTPNFLIPFGSQK